MQTELVMHVHVIVDSLYTIVQLNTRTQKMAVHGVWCTFFCSWWWQNGIYLQQHFYKCRLPQTTI